MKKLISGSIASLLVLTCCLIITEGNIQAIAIDQPCSDIDIVYARGSGQKLGDGEALRLKDQLNSRVVEPATMNFYELGSETYGGQKYQAVTVGEWWKNGNAVGAGMSAGLGNDYGRSVDSGVGELRSYLTQRSNQCPTARIVLGGYSQGAQVIGQALAGLSSDVQAKVEFVALFGDPKLYLPEGEGVYPPACYGANLSQWRRAVGNCKADNGSLGARIPFLPQSMESKTGLWCNADDFVCGTSLTPSDNVGHTQYKDTGGAIDLAVTEIAQRLKLILPLEKAVAINASKHTAGMGTTGTDTVFLLTASGWSSEHFAQAKEFIRSMASKLNKPGDRVAFVYYDGGVGWSYDFPTPLLEDRTEFHRMLGDAYLAESTTLVKPTLRVITDKFNYFQWKKGAVKSVVVVSNSDFFNPDNGGNVTFATVAKRALEIDPVNLYPVVPSSLQSSYQGLAEATSGQLIIADDNPETTLAVASTKIAERPTALLKNTEYVAKSGQEVTFDASDSYVLKGTITKYEWDFNGDGMFEQTTTTPIAAHSYPQRFKGNMQVRITGSNDTISNAAAVVNIDDYLVSFVPPAPVNLVTTISSTSNRVSTVDLSWSKPDGISSPPASWAVSVDGVVIGTLSGDRTSIQVTDILREKDVELGVRSMTYNGEVGDSASVVVPKLEPEPSPPKTASWLTRLFIYIRNIQDRQWVTLP